MSPRKMRRGVRLLVLFLNAALTDQTASLSAASRVKMRDWRIRACGWLWSLIAPLSGEEWCYFTVVLPSWWTSASDLKQVSAKGFTARFRAAMQRAGSSEATGWLYGMMHGGYDGTTDGFPLHMHGIATKGMMRVLERLREQPQFRRCHADLVKYPQVTSWKKLQINRPSGELPAGITYTSKSIWMQHNTDIDEKGNRHRVGRPHRIGGTAFVRHLLWLHSQPVKDQVLLIHLSVVRGELVERKRGASDSDQ